MANMSYCRMKNTYNDLRDAYNNWDDVKSESEIEYQKKILKLCVRIINVYDEAGSYITDSDKNA